WRQPARGGAAVAEPDAEPRPRAGLRLRPAQAWRHGRALCPVEAPARAGAGMTPFGAKLRDLRAGRKLPLKAMAQALGVSAAYLSALEHGHRGRPSSGLVQQISAYFNLAWDDVDELKRLAERSHPRAVVGTAGR